MKKHTWAILILIFIAIGLWIIALLIPPSRRAPSGLGFTRLKLHRLHTLCVEYREKRGEFPRERLWSRDLVLMELGERDFLDTDNRGFLEELFYDGWGRSFRYRWPGKHNPELFDLYSLGPNGTDEGGNGDDVGNWSAAFK